MASKAGLERVHANNARLSAAIERTCAIGQARLFATGREADRHMVWIRAELLPCESFPAVTILSPVDLARFTVEFADLMKPAASLTWKRRSLNGLVAFVGFLLSPLSWWNDLVVNVPLALAFAWVVSLLYRPAFEASFVLGYWLTNIVGMVLMHWGGSQALAAEWKPYDGKRFRKDLAIALAYTAVIVVLVKLGVLGPLPIQVGPR